MEYTVTDIRISYQEKMLKERKKSFFMYSIYRPISFYLTPAFLKCHISANLVTLIGLLILSTFPVVSVFGGEFAYLYVALLAFSFLTLDCVDGNISRITGSSSAFGQYLDSFAGNVFWVLLYFSVGLLTRYGKDVSSFFVEWGVVFGLLSALFDILGRESRAYVKLNLRNILPEYYPESKSSLSLFMSILSGFRHTIPFLLVIFGYLNFLNVLLVLVFVYSIFRFFYSELRIFFQLSMKNK